MVSLRDGDVVSDIHVVEHAESSDGATRRAFYPTRIGTLTTRLTAVLCLDPH